MFHNPKERCPFNPCLLGHDEARDALKASKAFGRVERLAKQQQELLQATDPAKPAETYAAQPKAPVSNPENQNPKPADETPKEAAPAPHNIPPADFQVMMEENVKIGQQNEFQRIYKMTERLKKDMDDLKKQTTEKEAAKEHEVRKLQEAMSAMHDENIVLREKNESERSLLNCYYKDVLEGASSTRALLDLEKVPPSETAVEGALVVLKTMFSKPVELEGAKKTIELFSSRLVTRFSDDVPTLQSLGLRKDSHEHAFFLRCYMQYPTDGSFCLNNTLDHSSYVVSLPPGGAFPPKASALKKAPRQFRRSFFTQSAARKVTNVSNASLSLKQGGGLTQDEPLPREIHTLLAEFVHKDLHKNPAVPLVSQFISYIQNGLVPLDQALLQYISPVYKTCPFKLREYKNGRKEVIKNKSHPLFEKWDSLINRTHFNTAYSTTRLTFPWKGFYLPGGRISNHRDKYAFLAFTYAADLFLGALPLWPLDASAQFQLDRKDPLRHYTLDNVCWLERSDNMANKPSLGKEKGTYVKTTKDVLKLLHACERNNQVCTEMLGALVKGYGTAPI